MTTGAYAVGTTSTSNPGGTLHTIEVLTDAELAQHLRDQHHLVTEGDETRAELEEAHGHLHPKDQKEAA